MTEVGRTLGSDVPFFFQAPCAIVSGRGEQVQPVALAGSRWIVLVNPGFGVETKWAYQQLAATRSEFQPVEEAYVRMEQGRQLTWEELLATAQNDFEQPVFEVYPSLGDIKRRLLAEGAEVALLSGSGATVFGVFPAESRALKAGAAFQTDPTLKVFAVPACSGPLVPRG
jgi:4-diphosphocytidyl-2-C-methyl-D-erythritol kinase